jgi:DNA-binding protein HU-beta
MTKADIVNEIAKNTGIEKVTVQKTVEALMETVKDSMIKVITYFSEVLEASLLRKELRKLQGIFQRIQP